MWPMVGPLWLDTQNSANFTSTRGSATPRKAPRIELPPPSPDAPRDMSSPISNTMQGGCLAWNGPPTNTDVIAEGPPPTGLVVSLLLGREHLDFVCGYFPTQVEHFILPQSLDVLFILPLTDKEDRVTMQELLQCLNLSHQLPKSEKIWTNLDMSTFATVEYTYDFMMSPDKVNSLGKAPSIFLAEPAIALPHHVRADPSLLQSPMLNGCSTPVDQIQGMRWHTNEMLHLSILKDYEYFVKLDTDVAFKKPLPFNLLHDMKLRGAVFGHTASFPESIHMPCGEELIGGIKNFELGWQAHSQQGPQTWKGTACSQNHTRSQVNADHYYSNLIVGRTDYFQRKEVQVLGEFLSEFQSGFFKNRWTDQIFWHHALGLFIGGPGGTYEATGVVADYTEFRCAGLPNCWTSFFGQKESDQCQNGGTFVHSRAVEQHRKDWSQVTLSSVAAAKRYSEPYQSRYQEECPASI